MAKFQSIIKIIERKSFIYYNDVNNNTFYIPRDIYEKCISLNLKWDSKPKIIQDKNYYSTTRAILNELAKTKEYYGIEKVLRLEREIIPKSLENVIMAYKDGKTGIIYISEKYQPENSANLKIILGKRCYPITERELERILNKKIIIATVFCKPKEQEKILVCKAGEKRFIKETAGITYGLSLINRKRIKIDNQIYIQVTEEELTLIQIMAKKEDKEIEFEKKEIFPKRN